MVQDVIKFLVEQKRTGSYVDSGDIDSVRHLRTYYAFISAVNAPIALNNVHQIISSRIGLADGNIHIVDFVLAANGLDLILIDIGQRHSICDGDAALFLPAEQDGRWALIQADAEAFKFGFDELFVA